MICWIFRHGNDVLMLWHTVESISMCYTYARWTYPGNWSIPSPLDWLEDTYRYSIWMVVVIPGYSWTMFGAYVYAEWIDNNPHKLISPSNFTFTRLFVCVCYERRSLQSAENVLFPSNQHKSCLFKVDNSVGLYIHMEYLVTVNSMPSIWTTILPILWQRWCEKHSMRDVCPTDNHHVYYAKTYRILSIQR